LTLDWYEHASPRYAVDLVLNNASLKEILPNEQAFGEGRITASLLAEGELSPKGYRRGRGAMRVQGKNMYKIPLLLGLVQMVDLALPATEPMNQVTADYILDNSSFRIESLEMRSPTTVIQAKGTIDLGTRKLDLILTTDSPQKLKIPGWEQIIGPLKKELFQIRLQGSLDEPKVHARALPTLQTTIDQMSPEGKKQTD
jgi:hypothetical protein